MFNLHKTIKPFLGLGAEIKFTYSKSLSQKCHKESINPATGRDKVGFPWFDTSVEIST